MIVPAVAANVAVVLPEPTVTDAGTVKAAVLRDRLTVAPPVFDTVTVHVELPPEPRLAGMHAKPLRVAGATKEIVAACVVPLSVAIRVAN